VFEAFRNHSEGQGLDAGDGFIAVGTVTHHAGQTRHFGNPAAVVLTFNLDRKNHVEYCTIRPGCLTSEWSRRAARFRANLCGVGARLIRKC